MALFFRKELIMKKYILSLILLCALVINVNAVSSNERVYADLTEYSCKNYKVNCRKLIAYDNKIYNSWGYNH